MRVHAVNLNDLAWPEGESCLIAPVYAGETPLACDLLAEDDEVTLQALIDKEIITGKAQECVHLPTPDSAYRGVLTLGLGERDKLAAETLRRAAGKAAPILRTHHVAHLVCDLTHHAEAPVEALVEGVLLAQYDFDVYKRAPEKPAARVESFTVVLPKGADPGETQRRCEIAALASLGANGARQLANTPPNEMTPQALADFALGIAEESGCECTILEEAQMASLGMNAILGVSRGSARPARLIVLSHHHADDAPTLAIVGKGITFDSGGISIKPAEGMHEMKYDMAGAAAVLCAMMTVAELKPAINVLCVVPAAENMTGDAAQRPGDIVKAYNGKTIEVHNTDAEGRLILADALAYTVDKYKPDQIVDLATLTGACVAALGHYAAGLFANDDALAQSLVDAGEQCGERLWRLPLWEDYCKLIEGNHADLCNIGPRGEAGAITAAAFIKEFVGDTPWAHIDIAGAAWGGKHIPYWDPKHATGYGVRLLIRWILDQAQRQ